MSLPDDIEQRMRQLQDKYAVIGQDMTSYLDGLLYSNGLTYWDYIHTDTLLSLQNPRTDFPDEIIFIGYHQITELYFKLILHELAQLTQEAGEDLTKWHQHLQRIIRYFDHLSDSFATMIDGMDKQQFLKFRMSLLPASGFQSVQYRMIELYSTSLFYLCQAELRSELAADSPTAQLYPHIYWKFGNIDLKTGRKTLTLAQFEKRYDEELMRIAEQYRTHNVYALYLRLPKSIRQNESLIEQLKHFDLSANVYWPLSHYRAAARHLYQKAEVLKATGGTNWQQFLPPKFRKVSFFPSLWTEQEITDWGKSWVQHWLKEAQSATTQNTPKPAS